MQCISQSFSRTSIVYFSKLCCGFFVRINPGDHEEEAGGARQQPRQRPGADPTELGGHRQRLQEGEGEAPARLAAHPGPRGPPTTPAPPHHILSVVNVISYFHFNLYSHNKQ